MCAKVAQNHETKEQKAKNPSRVLLSRISVYLCLDKEPLKQAGGSESGVLRGAKRPKVERIDKQITAE